jgi:DNA-binding NtrC family response regulator
MKRVLVVDDTKNIRTLLSTCLELNGYEVVTGNNGQEAIQIFKNEKIDLAFLDIKMPETSGTEVLRTIRSMGIHTPVVVMTAFATVKNAIECTKLGAVMYLQKPFTAEKVQSVLGEISQYSSSEEKVQNYIKLAKALLYEDKIDDAYEELKKALYVNPACGEAFYLIGTIFKNRGNVEESQKFFKAAENFGYEKVTD